jgi:hypothetical protein
MLDTSSAARPSGDPGHPTSRWLLALLMFLGSVIVGGIAGLLTYAHEPSVPEAIKYGAGSFAGTFLLLLAIAAYLGSGRR